jgi:regulator of RNase E activity RraA
VSSSEFNIHPPPALAPSEIVEALRQIVTPHISDSLQRVSGVVGLTRYHRSRKLVGTAFTVKTRPGDNLLIYKALMDMSPGHVLVVDGGADTTNALVGELIMLYAQQRGCAGFVLDAAIRDSAAFFEADFPCYARGSSHRGPYKVGPGTINVPVSVGVVSFPASDARRILDAVAKIAANESRIKDEIATGARDQAWLHKVLAAHGLSE